MADIYEAFQSLGKYESRVLLLFVTIGYLANAPAKFGALFTGKDIDFLCVSNVSLKYEDLAENSTVNQCSLNDTFDMTDLDEMMEETTFESYNDSTTEEWMRSCPYYAFDLEQFDFTVVERYELVCDKAKLLQYSSVFYLLGYVIGAAISGIFSDQFGRKKVLVSGAIIGFIANVVSNYCPDFMSYLACRTFLGLADVSVFTSAAVLTMELVKRDQREVVQLALGIMMGVCDISVGVTSMLIRHYRHVHLMIASIYFLCVMFYSFYLVESPRWLTAVRRPDDARKVVESIAKYNHSSIASLKHLLYVDSRVSKSIVFDIFVKPVVRTRCWILYFIWFSLIFSRFVVVQNTGDFSPDMRVNIIICGAVEAPVILPVIFSARKLGRQITTFSLLLSTGLVCLTMGVVAFTQNSDVPVTVLGVFGRIFTSTCISVLYLFTQELLPTVLRNVGLGFCTSIGYIGAMVLPQIQVLGLVSPLFIAGVMAVVSALSVLALPDTTWLDLAAGVKDCVKFKPGHAYNFCLPDIKLRGDQDEKSRNGCSPCSPMSDFVTMESCVDV